MTTVVLRQAASICIISGMNDGRMRADAGDATARTVIATGFGDRDTGGGAFALEQGRVRRLDWLASTGLAVDGRRVARLLRDGGDGDSSGELLISDARGIELYRRVDRLSDAHDAVWHDGALVIASTSTNSLLWLSQSGDLLKTWEAPGRGDAWHLNSLLVDRGRLLACAFGRFAEHRGWAEPGAAQGRGFVFDVETGDTLVGDLTCPHHPFRLGGRLAVCDSFDGAVVVFDDDGGVRERVRLGGWTRGVAVAGDQLHVGVSARRHVRTGGRAEIVALDARTLEERARVAVPCREIYALAVVSPELVAGLERGFRTNSLRVGDADQHALFRAAGVEPELLWPVADPLPAAGCRTTLEAVLPDALRAGETVEVPWRLTNRGGAILHPFDPHPVRIGARWQKADGPPTDSGARADLGRSVPPGTSVDGTFSLTAPADAGEHVLHVSPVQELVHWFDEIDPANGIRKPVSILAAAGG